MKAQLLAAALGAAVVLTAGPASAAPTGPSVQTGVQWEELSPPDSPRPRTLAAMAYDPVRDQFVMFGGNAGEGGTSETWIFDGETWTRLELAVRPPGRLNAGMVYDAARKEIVLFGGSCDCADPVKGDTWTFDGEAWTERTPEVSPSERYGVGMAYDPVHRNVVLFGGRGGGEQSDTWVWDGRAWEEQHPTRQPEARSGAGMASSKGQRQVVLFGGKSVAGELLDDTWTWDGANWTRDRGEPRISPRHRPGMSSYGRRVVLYGGSNDTTIEVGETWAYGPNGWRERARGGSPGRRAAPAMAYDSTDRQVLLFGGSRSDGSAGDTWVLLGG